LAPASGCPPRQRSGKGQVVDAAVVDGAIALMAMFIGLQHQGSYCDTVGRHFLAGAAQHDDTYATRDGKFIAIGALEPQFYADLIEKAGVDPATFAEAGRLACQRFCQLAVSCECAALTYHPHVFAPESTNEAG
jgi:alpha-methylacyl-CoA racemase